MTKPSKLNNMADGIAENTRTNTCFNAALDQVCAKFGIREIREEQRKAIEMFFEGKDVFVSLPTGYGKSFIFQAIPVIASLLWKKPCTVFIVSPLKALMEDQVLYLNSLGFKAVALNEEADDGVIERVMNGEYSHVYGSPESFLAQDKWRGVFTSNTFKEHLVGVAVDEAHCISHWGLPGERSVPFREWFGNLGELRSLIPQEARLVVVTATATKSTRVKIFQTLHLGPQTAVVERSPDRPNLKYSAIYINKSQPFEQIFSELIKELKECGKKAERTMIYCQTRKQCAILFRTFSLFLGDKLFNRSKHATNRMVEMYHAGTPAAVKKHIVDNLSCDDGHIRCLVTTVAFGMGVNCKRVRKIYHMGPAKNLECYVQESGRGGRDGLPCVCILLYNGILSNHCEQDVKDYCKMDQCRRDALLAPFGEKPNEVTPKHSCCDNCALNCSCGLDSCKNSFELEMTQTVELPCHSQMTRPVTKENKLYLMNALKKFRKDEVNKQLNKLDQLVSCPNVLLELGDFMIDQVLENCYRIFNVQDVFNYVEVWRKEHAVAIVNIISQCFGDIGQVAELDAQILDDIDIDMDWEELRDDSTLIDMAQSIDDDSFSTDCDETLTAATSLNSSSFLGSIVNNLP